MGLKLLDLDLFGSTIGFKTGDDFRKRSYLGLCFTFAFIGMLFFFLFYFGSKYINKDIIYQETTNLRFQNSQNITLNDTFVFGLSSSLQGLNQEKNDYFYVEIRFLKYVNKLKTEEIYLKSVNCNVYDWSLTDSQYIEFKIDQFLCFNTTGLKLDGNFMSQNYSYLDIKYFVNLTENLEDNNRKLLFLEKEAPVVSFQMVDTMYRYNSSFKGKEKFLLFKQLDLIPASSSIAYLFINVNQAKFNKDNFFGGDAEELYDFSMKEYDYYFMPFTIKNPYVVNYKIFSSLSTFQFSFTPKSFTEYISELGGFINLSMIVFFAASNYFNNFHFNYILVKSQIDLINDNFAEELKLIKGIKENPNIINDSLQNNNIINNKTSKNKVNCRNIPDSNQQEEFNSKFVAKNIIVDLNKINNINESKSIQQDQSFNSNNGILMINTKLENNDKINEIIIKNSDLKISNKQNNNNDTKVEEATTIKKKINNQLLNINEEEFYFDGPSKSAEIANTNRLMHDINLRMNRLIKNKKSDSLNQKEDKQINMQNMQLLSNPINNNFRDYAFKQVNKPVNKFNNNNIRAKEAYINNLLDHDSSSKQGIKQSKLNIFKLIFLNLDFLKLRSKERKVSFTKYLCIKIYGGLIPICNCCTKIKCFDTNKKLMDFVTQIEKFIDLSYSALKYQEVVQTSFLLKEILLDEEQKTGFKRMDYEDKLYLVE